MLDINFTKRDFLVDEVDVNHDVLGPSVMNRVGSRQH